MNDAFEISATKVFQEILENTNFFYRSLNAEATILKIVPKDRKFFSLEASIVLKGDFLASDSTCHFEEAIYLEVREDGSSSILSREWRFDPDNWSGGPYTIIQGSYDLKKKVRLLMEEVIETYLETSL